MKLMLDKDKTISTLKGAGVVFADDKTADAAFVAIESMLPTGEVFSEQEVDDKVKELREENKDRRQAFDTLAEKLTGKKRDDYDKDNRNQVILDDVNTKLTEAQTKVAAYDEKYAPMEEELKTYRTKAETGYRTEWEKLSETVTSIITVDENAKYKDRFVLPEEGKELDFEGIQKNVDTFKELKELGVPAFQVESNTPPEERKTPSKSKETNHKGRTKEEFDKWRAENQIY